MIKLKSLLVEEFNKAELQSKVEVLQRQLYQKYPQLEDLHIYIQSNGSLFLGSIKVKPEFRGQGIGKNVVREIKAFADSNKLTIVLSPEPERGYKKGLDRFYKDLGFVPNQGRKKDYRLASFFGKTMYRKPGIDETEGSEKIIAYHGTGERFRRFNLKYSTQGIIWFTSNKQSILAGEVGAQGKGFVITAELAIKNPAGWDEYDRYSIGELIRLGYDGVILDSTENQDMDYIVFDPKQIKILKYDKIENKKITELISPYPVPLDTDSKQGFIGSVLGRVVAYDKPVPDVMAIDHSELPNGRNGSRFRYFLKSPKNTVLWNEFPPSEEDKHKVEDWLSQRGISNPKHINYREYSYLLTGKWEGIDAGKLLSEENDYDPGWDYDVVKRPLPAVKKLVDSILRDLNPLKKRLGFHSVHVHYINAPDDELARYIAGTMDNPHFVLNSNGILKAAKEYKLNLGMVVETTLVHEFGHAYLEMCGISTLDHDEDVVEEFAHDFYDYRNIDTAMAVLDGFVQENGQE